MFSGMIPFGGFAYHPALSLTCWRQSIEKEGAKNTDPKPLRLR